MNLNPFINLISNILSLYSFSLLVWLVIGWLMRFDIINGHQSFVKQIMNLGNRLFEPVLSQIRRILPFMLGIDLSPVLLLLLLNFIKEFLYTYLYKF